MSKYLSITKKSKEYIKIATISQKDQISIRQRESIETHRIVTMRLNLYMIHLLEKGDQSDLHKREVLHLLSIITNLIYAQIKLNLLSTALIIAVQRVLLLQLNHSPQEVEGRRKSQIYYSLIIKICIATFQRKITNLIRTHQANITQLDIKKILR